MGFNAETLAAFNIAALQMGPLLAALALLLDARFERLSPPSAAGDGPSRAGQIFGGAASSGQGAGWLARAHPSMLLSHASAWMAARFASRSGARISGAAALFVLAGAAAAAGFALERIPLLGPILAVLATATILAQRSLITRVEAAAQATARLEEPSPAARRAVESAASGFSSFVVAPVFWFAIAGAPGVFAYVAVQAFARTMARGARFEFGWAAAGLEFLMTLIPDRIAAVLLAAAGPHGARALKTAARDARKWPGPSGWPPAAMAGALGLRLGSDAGAPVILPEGRVQATARDVRLANRLVARAWILLVTGLLIAVCGQIALDVVASAPA